MKLRSFFILIILSIPAFSFAQSTSLPLGFNSYAIKLCVSKDESLVLTTKAGEVGLSNSMQSVWRRSEPRVDKEYLKPTLEQANFFNKDTGFIAGFIQGKNGKYNLIYHTTDGGITWNSIDFNQAGWVDDAINLDNGEAWMSVAGSGIAYTRDYGFTWRKLEIPEVKQRFTSIFFNTKRKGLIGSLWNYLAYTDNNCKTWKIIPTPLDQKKYNKTNRESRPEFNRVAIFDDYFIVKQENLVFYTKRDSINWQWLKDYDDFYTDPLNSAMFFKTLKGSIIRVDHDFIPVYFYQNVITGYDSRCKNGSLFIASADKMQQLTTNGLVVSVPFTSKNSARMEPATIGYLPDGMIGVLNEKAYINKSFNGKWEYLFDFPCSVDEGSLSIISSNLILYNRSDDSLFYFNLTGAEVSKVSKTKMVEEFCKAGIKNLIFSAGSQGCFHSYADILMYSNNNGFFANQVEQSTGSKHKELLPDNDGEISERTVVEFVKNIPSIFDTANFATIGDLGFTGREYEQCKNDILDFKRSVESTRNHKKPKFRFNRNNLDFNRLLSLVDSIKNLDKKRLNQSLFRLSDLWSTTTNWCKVQLINNNGQTLTILNSYYERNAFCFPWVITLNGYSVATTNIEINRFLKEVYPSFLSESGRRIEVLYRLVKDIY